MNTNKQIVIKPKGKNKYGVLQYKYIGFISLALLPIAFYSIINQLYEIKVIDNDYTVFYVSVIGIASLIFSSIAIIIHYYKYANKIYTFEDNRLTMYKVLNKGSEEYKIIEKSVRKDNSHRINKTDITPYAGYTTFMVLVSFLKTLYYDHIIYDFISKINGIKENDTFNGYEYTKVTYEKLNLLKNTNRYILLSGRSNNFKNEKIKIYKAYTNIETLVKSIQ